MAQYAGRDNARPARMLWWCDGIGDVRVVDLDAEPIADHLDRYASEARQKYTGRDEPVADTLTWIQAEGRTAPVLIVPRFADRANWERATAAYQRWLLPPI